MGSTAAIQGSVGHLGAASRTPDVRYQTELQGMSPESGLHHVHNANTEGANRKERSRNEGCLAGLFSCCR